MSTLNLRINHKFDTYENWLKSTLVLNKGEFAIAEIPSGQTFTEPDGSTRLTPPAIGVKVGDGSKTFAQLPWIQATAGDVYAWAKAENKPSYKAEEIEGISDYIANEIQDTNTIYQFSYANDTLTIESKEKGSDEWTKVVDLPITLSAKMDKDTDAVEGNLAKFDANGNAVDAGVKIGDYYNKTEADAKFETIANVGALEETVSGINERLGTAEGDIDDLQAAIETLNGTGDGSIDKKIDTAFNEFAAELSDDGIVNTYKELIDYAATHGSEFTELVGEVEANADAIAALEEDSHVHANAEVLNGITAEKVASWDKVEDAVTRLGTAEGEIDALQADSHTHANKAELDLIASGDKAKWDTAAAKAEENAGAIAGLEEDVTRIDGVLATAVQTVSGVTTEKTGTDVKVTAVPVTLLTNVEGDTLVLNCGTASTVI